MPAVTCARRAEAAGRVSEQCPIHTNRHTLHCTANELVKEQALIAARDEQEKPRKCWRNRLGRETGRPSARPLRWDCPSVSRRG